MLPSTFVWSSQIIRYLLRTLPQPIFCLVEQYGVDIPFWKKESGEKREKRGRKKGKKSTPILRMDKQRKNSKNMYLDLNLTRSYDLDIS